MISVLGRFCVGRGGGRWCGHRRPADTCQLVTGILGTGAGGMCSQVTSKVAAGGFVVAVFNHLEHAHIVERRAVIRCNLKRPGKVTG